MTYREESVSLWIGLCAPNRLLSNIFISSLFISLILYWSDFLSNVTFLLHNSGSERAGATTAVTGSSGQG